MVCTAAMSLLGIKLFSVHFPSFANELNVKACGSLTVFHYWDLRRVPSPNSYCVSLKYRASGKPLWINATLSHLLYMRRIFKSARKQKYCQVIRHCTVHGAFYASKQLKPSFNIHKLSLVSFLIFPSNFFSLFKSKLKLKTTDHKNGVLRVDSITRIGNDRMAFYVDQSTARIQGFFFNNTNL